MRLLLSLLVLTATPALAAEPAPKAAPASPSLIALAPLQTPCPHQRSAERIGKPEDSPMSARKLADLPPANMELTVLRRIDGCPAPVIVRYGVDRRPDEPAPVRR